MAGKEWLLQKTGGILWYNKGNRGRKYPHPFSSEVMVSGAAFF
jgi:hypothetical protein